MKRRESFHIACWCGPGNSLMKRMPADWKHVSTVCMNTMDAMNREQSVQNSWDPPLFFLCLRCTWGKMQLRNSFKKQKWPFIIFSTIVSCPHICSYVYISIDLTWHKFIFLTSANECKPGNMSFFSVFTIKWKKCTRLHGITQLQH